MVNPLNSGFPCSNVAQFYHTDMAQSTNQAISVSRSIRSDTVSISQEAMSRCSDMIVGMVEPDMSYQSLTDDQVKRLEEIDSRINQIFGTKTPSNAELKQADGIYGKIDALYEDGRLTAEEEKSLLALQEKLDSIFGKPRENLTDAEVKELDELYAEENKILQASMPDAAGFIYAVGLLDEITGYYAETDTFQNPPAEGGGCFVPLDMLTGQDRSKVEKLLSELDAIFAGGMIEKQPSADDEKRLAEIEKRVGEIHGIKEPSAADLKKADAVYQKIDTLFEDGLLTTEEEKSLTEFEKKLENIFGKPRENLTEAETKELEELYAEENKLLGLTPPSEEERKRADHIMVRLEQMFLV